MPNTDITIHILPNGGPEGGPGTFVGPPPLVRVKKNQDTVTFKVTPANFTFDVIFSGFSPLDNANPISDRYAGPFNAKVLGQFHYQVQVTDPGSGERWVIANCPELDVG